MIVETGRVMQTKRGTALVECVRKAACGDCHARERCGMTEGAESLLLEVVDPIGVRVGQSVRIALAEDSAFKASVIVYGIPLLAVIIGGLTGDWLGKASGSRDIWAMIGTFGGLVVSMMIVRLLNNWFKRDSRNHPVITGIVESSMG